MSVYKFNISQAKMYHHHLAIEANSLDEAALKAQIAMNLYLIRDEEQHTQFPGGFHFRDSGEIIYEPGFHTMLNIESEDLEDIDGVDVYEFEGKKRFASIEIVWANDCDFENLDEAFEHLRKCNEKEAV